MGEDTIQNEALSELQYEARREAVARAKELIKGIAQQQEAILFATKKIAEMQVELNGLKVKEYTI